MERGARARQTGRQTDVRANIEEQREGKERREERRGRKPKREERKNMESYDKEGQECYEGKVIK